MKSKKWLPSKREFNNHVFQDHTETRRKIVVKYKQSDVLKDQKK